MKKIVQTECFLFLFLIIGCAYIPFFEKSSSETVKKSDSQEEQLLESNNFVEKGRIVDAQGLQKGKNIAIIPFKADVGVEANDELDKIALMIVKGVSDAFADDHSGKHDRFNILTSEDFQMADLIVEGHINDVGSPSKVSRWVLLKGQKSLGVDGKMIDAQTGEAILIFADSRKTKAKTENHRQLGYRIGKNIGLFILSGIE